MPTMPEPFEIIEPLAPETVSIEISLNGN